MPVFGLPAIFEEGEKTIHDKPQMALGACFGANVDDVLYTYVRFAENVQEGDVMRTKLDHYTKSGLSPKTSGGTDFPAAGSQIISEHDATYLTSLAGIPPEPSNRDYAIIAITGGAGAGQRGYITHYTDKVLNVRWYDTDDGTLKTALGSNSNYVIYAPWYFAQAAANADAAARASVNGVVLARSARKDQYGLVGVEGNFPVVMGEDVVAGDVLIPGHVSATRGEAMKASAADIPRAFATSQHAGPANNLVECTVYCEKISIVREIAEGLVRGFDRPEAV